MISLAGSKRIGSPPTQHDSLSIRWELHSRSCELDSMRQRPPLWICPKCQRRFANRNQRHTCGLTTLAAHFDGKPEAIRELYQALESAIFALGPVRILPEKTRIAFQVRMSFAVAQPRKRWLDGHLVLARRIDHPRFRRVETFSRRNHLHAFRLTSKADLDAEFIGWLKEAYAVGRQDHLGCPSD